ncbi:MAG: hypothetical protein JWP01_4081 [Myxococcales bacterium]|nr:hypothetical protein [Myxococcales bacterium]
MTPPPTRTVEPASNPATFRRIVDLVLGPPDAASPSMQPLPDRDEFEDDQEPKRTDASALRILAHWVADHDGEDPHTGLVIDRDFVVVDVPTMTSHKVL